ncbi:MAG: alkaline phosphatase family protein [Chitinispirillia bacterium]
MKEQRRKFLKKSLQTACAVGIATSLPGKSLIASPAIKKPGITGRVFVLGIDGMDLSLLTKFIYRGEMPSFEKFIQKGSITPLQTTLPSQSPVAWSSFITGNKPGHHGIFDFIHRDPENFSPYLSTVKTHNPKYKISLGPLSLPLGEGKYELMRKGIPFWRLLEEEDIPVTAFKVPAYFPVSRGTSKMISGMSTPDLLGTYGTFTYFTNCNIPDAENFTGGRVVPVSIQDGVIQTYIKAFPHPFLKEPTPVHRALKINLVEREGSVKISIKNREITLKQGKWSDWIPVIFDIIPFTSSVQGIVRFYLQSIYPEFRLYMSPINIDPVKPGFPISNPKSYARDIADSVGRFYTQGFPEDTKALSNGIFNDVEFLRQSDIVFRERLDIFHHEMDRFKEGMLFYYFSSIDQNSHMLYRLMDREHPQYDPDAPQEAKDGLYNTYKKFDSVISKTMSKMKSNDTVIILSDHGFAPFTREFHLSTWLKENGYITTVKDNPDALFFSNVDWNKTRAYPLGLNGLYINQSNREVMGSVPSNEVESLKLELIEKLNKVTDPLIGLPIIHKAYDARKVYSGKSLDDAPDIIIGYEKNYRISDESAFGKFPREIFGDRTNKWSADHCIDPSLVPGVLITSKPIGKKQAAIWDIGPSILNCFGIKTSLEMDGKSIWIS